MKIWVDDLRQVPKGYVWCKTVNETKDCIKQAEKDKQEIELIDLDHDAGDYGIKEYGGDYIKILDWMEETGRNYPCRLHTANPVGKKNMTRIIEKNGWKLIW